MKKRNRIVLGITALIIVIFGVATSLYFNYVSSITEQISDSEDYIEFTIDEGDSTKIIAENLLKAGLIKNSLYFEIYVRTNDLATTFQAGHYTIPANVTMEELAQILQVAYEQDVWVTIPEGMMMIEIADLIAEKFGETTNANFNRNEFIEIAETTQPVIDAGLPVPDGKPCEGYLFPDTYRFSQDSSSELVLETLLKNFKTKIYDIYNGEINDYGYSLYEVITLASILEKETYHSNDRYLVADILERRMDNGWALEVDATLLYYFQDWEHDITTEELQIDTPYNTRKYQGLTPTPINNPGEETISAVINPQPNDYWFYVSDEDGNLYYGKTLDEHYQNIQQYLSP